MHTIKRKLKSALGFSLAETFLAVLILLMVSTIVASGIPVAADVYKKVVEAANAQLLLSTTMTVLRDELGTATILATGETGGTEYIEYMVEGGKLQIVTDEEGIKKKAGEHSVLLVSNGAANKNLHASYESVSFSDGVVTFENLEAKNDRGATLSSIDEYKIRVLTFHS